MKNWFRKIADLATGPTPYTGETPQKVNDREQLQRDYTRAPIQAPEVYNWAATPTFVLVGQEDPQSLMQKLDWDQRLPFATGQLQLAYRWDADWQVLDSNMSLRQVETALRKYTKEHGWNFLGLTKPTGEKLSSLRYAEVPGIGEINPGVKDWKNKEWSDMETYDNGTNNGQRPLGDFYGEQDPTSEGEMSTNYVCSDCGYPASDYNDWRGHIMREHVRGGEPSTDPMPWQPVVDYDIWNPVKFDNTIKDQTIKRQSGWHVAADTQGPVVPGPIPFIYDIDQDRIYVGHPGQRVSDIQGQFTPGGIVEGNYDPKGNVQIRTDTDMPYTVKHMVRLWYAMHPELEVKGVHLLVGQEQYKLASANIGHKVRNAAAADPAAWAAFEALSPYGSVYAVGGAVRDVVNGKVPNDIDLLVQGIPVDEVRAILSRLPGKLDETGADFSVLRYKDPSGAEAEIALPRRERSTGTGHKDFDVQADPFMSIEEDLSRRDFTANAMAVNLATGELVDPYHGSQDIKNGELKTVSEKSFEDDPLRMLRAMTAISKHKLMPTRETLEAIRDNAYRIDHLPAERIQAELDKMIKGPDPAMAISLLEGTGIFKYIIPEYEKTINFDQKNPHHDLRLHDHLKQVLSEMSKMSDDPDLRWAALLHDIGKPRSQWLDPETGSGHYYKNEHGHGDDHWTVGANMSREILGRLRFPQNRIDRISHLIDHHMFPAFNTERGARKFINRVGDEHADDLLRLRQADTFGHHGEYDGDVPTMWGHIKTVRDMQQPTGISSLAINGKDLIAAGFQPGPQMGAILKYLAEQVIENPELNDPNTLLTMAGDIYDPARTANILDPIQKTLDPRVFQKPEADEPRVKQRLSNWVRTKVYDTMRQAGWPDPAEYLTLVLTGSLTTYQWSDRSDFDVSLWVDVDRFPEWVRADLIKLMIEKCDGVIVPGTTHPLQCFVVDSTKIKREDIYKPGMRSAYDLERNEWIVPPEHREVDTFTVYRSATSYAKEVVDKIKLMLRYGNDDALKTYWDFLHRQRHRDMAAGKGDFSTWNIVYKMIANEDLFPAISEATGEYIA